MSIAPLSASAKMAVSDGMLAWAARCSPLVFVMLWMLCGDTLAGPSVGALIAACERGVAQGNAGVDSALCEWYAVPCDCKLTRPDAAIEPWCMPASESIDDAMLMVMGELQHVPDRSVPAEQVVPGILARLYPCPR